MNLKGYFIENKTSHETTVFMASALATIVTTSTNGYTKPQILPTTGLRSDAAIDLK